MRKTRILASLLCIMMIVCSLPVMLVSAAEGDTYASVSAILGFPAGADSSLSYNFEGGLSGSSGATTTLNTTGITGTVDYNEEGMYFVSEDSTLWYAKPQSTNPYKAGTATVFTFKFETNSDKMNIQINNPYVSSRAFSDVTASKITTYGGTLQEDGTYILAGNIKYEKEYAFGTDWNDLMYVFSETGYQVYVRKTAGNGPWTLLQEITGYRNSTTYGFVSISTAAATDGVVIKSLTTYTEKTSFDNMDEILGGATGASYAFDFNEKSSLANTPDRIGYVVPTGAEVDQDGLTFGAEADLASANFNFYPFANWSPLNASDNYTSGFEPQAFYMMAKGAMNLQLAAPTGTGHGRVYLDIKLDKTLSPWADTGTKTEYNTVTVVDEWMEYLIVPNGTSTADAANGYTLYAKGATATSGKWLKVVKTSAYNKAAYAYYAKTGIQFFGLTGHVKKVRTFAMNRSAADAETIPTGADYLYFSEEFDGAPAYKNTSFQTVKYEEGNAVMPCTDTTGYSKVIVKGLEIPVGGYAEFKARAGGAVQYYFYDGENLCRIVQQSDYGTVTGGSGYSANSTETWKTWRVKRTAEGYTIYGKADGDSGWYIHTQNASEASNTEAQINLTFRKRNDGETGDSQLAYLKVYGPAPTEKLTLTDGYNTQTLADNATLTYPSSFRAIVTEETGKLLVVSYKGDDMLKAQIVNVADMVDDSALLNATADGATKVKVFLWDSFSGLNRKTPAVTLNL